MEKTKYTNKKIFLMSLPIFVEKTLQLLVGNIDQIMLSGNDNAVSAIINSNSIISLAIIVITMFSAATIIILTHKIGANEQEKIPSIFSAGFVITESISIVIAALLIFFGRNILILLNAPAEILDDAYTYLWIVAISLVIQGYYLSVAALLQSYSDFRNVMISAVVMNLTNIVGNVILINGLLGFPKLGVAGAAISTLFSKVVGAVLITFFIKKSVPIKIGPKSFFSCSKNSIITIVKLAIPTGGETLSYNTAQIVILSFVNLFGTSVITTQGYCNIIANFSYLYSVAIAQATQIVVGYLYGEGNVKEIGKRIHATTIICFVVSVGLSVLFWIFADKLLLIFKATPEIIELGTKVLFIEIFLEMGRSVNIVMSRCLVTIDDIYFPVVIGIIFQWLAGTGLSYVLGIVFNLGLVGIVIARMCDEVLRGIIFEIRFNCTTLKRIQKRIAK